MSSHTIANANYIDKVLTKDSSISYSDYYRDYLLSIQFSLDGFSFCVIDIERNKHLAIKSYFFQEIEDYETLCNEIENIISENELLKRAFHTININFESQKSTLVPSPLFDKSEIDSYLKFNHKIQHDEEIFFDELKNLEAYNIYAIPNCIREKIRSKFYKYKISNFSSTLIESLLINHKNQSLKNKVFTNIRPSYFDIIIIEDKQLIYYNAFRYRTKEDLIYFLIFTLEQLKLNPEIIDLVLLGEINKSSNYYEILFNYIRNISFIERNDYFKYSYVLDEVPSNYYYNLLNISLCEL